MQTYKASQWEKNQFQRTTIIKSLKKKEIFEVLIKKMNDLNSILKARKEIVYLKVDINYSH